MQEKSSSFSLKKSDNMEVVMNQLNEFAAKASTLAKNSYEKGSELTRLMTEESSKIAEHQMEQTRDLFELGFQTQKDLLSQWVTGVTNARDMWWEAAQSLGKSLDNREA